MLILINVNVNCEIMEYNKHQQQITNKLIICKLKQKTKSSMYRTVMSQNRKPIKFLKFLPLTVPIILFIYYA